MTRTPDKSMLMDANSLAKHLWDIYGRWHDGNCTSVQCLLDAREVLEQRDQSLTAPLQERIGVLEEALKFYADGRPAYGDKGDIARIALSTPAERDAR